MSMEAVLIRMRSNVQTSPTPFIACRTLAFRKWILAHQLAASGGATPNPNAPPNQSKQPMRHIFVEVCTPTHTHTAHTTHTAHSTHTECHSEAEGSDSLSRVWLQNHVQETNQKKYPYVYSIIIAILNR